MVHNFARVAVAVVALNAAASLAQYQFDNAELETRETAPYVRRHLTRAELAERDYEEISDLESRGIIPESLKAGWAAFKNNRKVQKQAGKAAKAQQKAAAKGAGAPGGGAGASGGAAGAPGGGAGAPGGPDPSASPDTAVDDPSTAAPQRRDLESDFYELDARDLDYELDDLE